jgi:hypothetical protein
MLSCHSPIWAAAGSKTQERRVKKSVSDMIVKGETDVSRGEDRQKKEGWKVENYSRLEHYWFYRLKQRSHRSHRRGIHNDQLS